MVLWGKDRTVVNNASALKQSNRYITVDGEGSSDLHGTSATPRIQENTVLAWQADDKVKKLQNTSDIYGILLNRTRTKSSKLIRRRVRTFNGLQLDVITISYTYAQCTYNLPYSTYFVYRNILLRVQTNDDQFFLSTASIFASIIVLPLLITIFVITLFQSLVSRTFVTARFSFIFDLCPSHTTVLFLYILVFVSYLYISHSISPCSHPLFCVGTSFLELVLLLIF